MGRAGWEEGTQAEWEEPAGRREQRLCCCLSLTLHRQRRRCSTCSARASNCSRGLIPRAAVQLLSYLVQSMHRNVGGLDVLQVSLSIVLEIVGDAEPVKEVWGGYLLLGLVISPSSWGWVCPRGVWAGYVPGESGHTVINSSGD